jgi:hypothetical protein
MRHFMLLAVVLLAAVAACAGTRPDATYRPLPRGTMDLTTNLDARHCSDLTGDFRDAYGLEAAVPAIVSIAVAADASRATLRTADALVPASEVISDRDRVCALWHYADQTLAVVLHHGHCPGNACPAQVSLIKYNGARTPADRPAKLCYERWVGAFERVIVPRRSE